MALKAHVIDSNQNAAETIPTLRGVLEYDEKRDALVVVFDATRASEMMKPRPYTDKEGKQRHTVAFRVAASGNIDGFEYRLQSGRMGTVSLTATAPALTGGETA
jgi:hypothetical protein